MKRRIVLLVLVFTVVLNTGVDAWNQNLTSEKQFLATHSILLEGISWEAYELDCQVGDVLSGSFDVTCDGSLYSGDEQKYDDWSLEGIQFYILSEVNYSLFADREPFETSYSRNDVISHNWSFEIPEDGLWYVVYDNNSIYLMVIDGNINHANESDTLVILLLGVIGGIGVLSVGLVIKRK